MIFLKTLKWSNLFSYGENNQIHFTASPLTQIVGKNGHGKSSIALVLEEVLYNKNSKGIKKGDILNRNIKGKTYSIDLTFDKDGDEYEINSVRGTTQTVKLKKNGVDISSHTATATYKTIEEIIGYDHKTFCQIVYQSSSNSLEFLTATDSARKKFLIDLLNLGRYIEIGDVFKEAAKNTDLKISELSGKITTIDSWLSKYKNFDFSVQEIQELPEPPLELEKQNIELQTSIKNIDSTNKKIVQNNEYKKLLDSIKPTVPGPKPELDYKFFNTKKIELTKTVEDCDKFIAKMNKLGNQCPTCLQDIDSHKIESLLEEQYITKQTANVKLKQAIEKLKTYEQQLQLWEKQLKLKQEYEEYHSLHDPNLGTVVLDKTELETAIRNNLLLIEQSKTLIKKIEEANSKAVAHNAKIDVLKTQQLEMLNDLKNYKSELEIYSDKLNTLQILTKTFSSSGLVAYKIECLVKDLEELTNKYLAELSDGRFQLSFRMTGNDKLNVVITDNGKDIEILALSSGEKARVNIATLLGIRKLMQSISNSRINLLILDETIENLDLEGKEKLVEVLLQEPHLNTFVISHGFNHPLLEKITVAKNKGISRIEYG